MACRNRRSSLALMLQCGAVAVCCSVLPCVAVCLHACALSPSLSPLQHTAISPSVYRRPSVDWLSFLSSRGVLQYVLPCVSQCVLRCVLQCVLQSVLQCVVVCWSACCMCSVVACYRTRKVALLLLALQNALQHTLNTLSLPFVLELSTVAGVGN